MHHLVVRIPNLPSLATGDLYNQMVHFTTRRCTLQLRNQTVYFTTRKLVSVKLFWELAGALETVCICKGTLDSRIMLVAKLPQMPKTTVFDSSGNQLHETRTNAIQGQVLLTRISWQALCKPTSRWICKTVRNVLDNAQSYHCTGPSNFHKARANALLHRASILLRIATHCLHNAILFLHRGLAYGCTKLFIIWMGCTRQACAAIRLHRACNYTA